jgi:hypothetical protein
VVIHVTHLPSCTGERDTTLPQLPSIINISRYLCESLLSIFRCLQSFALPSLFAYSSSSSPSSLNPCHASTFDVTKPLRKSSLGSFHLKQTQSSLHPYSILLPLPPSSTLYHTPFSETSGAQSFRQRRCLMLPPRWYRYEVDL